MARNYPHITPRSGPFPYLDGVNVWKWRNAFNYKRWGKQATIQLANVPYPADLSEVVDWKSEEQRDEVLDSYVLGEYYGPFETNFRMDKNTVVKVPIPFDVADPANYLIVRNRPAATVGNVAYEDTSGVANLFFFILDCEQIAPNTTRLTLKLDVWTTYRHLVDFAAGLVERGHAPMWAAADVDTYLTSPLDHTDHLTAPDIHVNNEGELVTWNRPTLLDHNRFMVAWVWDFDIRQMGLFDRETDRYFTPTSRVDGQITAPAYSGEYHENVNGWQWNLGADTLPQDSRFRTVANSRAIPPHAIGWQSQETPGPFVYSVDANVAAEFFDQLSTDFPHLFQNIKAVFIIPSRMVNISFTHPMCGVGVNLITPKRVKVDIQLSREQFNYPAEYAELTKLYTSPYSKLVMSDLFGNVQEVAIEQTTSKLHIDLMCQVLSGCSIRFELGGVGGAEGRYQWTPAHKTDEEETTLAAYVGQYFLEKNMPCFALTMSAEQKYDLAAAKLREQKRQQAITAYKNSQRAAGTGFDNTMASNKTAYDTGVASANTAYSTGEAAANTAKENADTAADAAHASAYASAGTAYTQAKDAATAARASQTATNAANTALNDNTTAGVRASNEIEKTFLQGNNQQQKEKATFQFNINRQTRAANLAVSVDYQAQSLQNQLAAQAAQFKINGVGTAVTQGVNNLTSGIQTAISAGAALIGGGSISDAIAQVGSTAVSSLGQTVNTGIGIAQAYQQTQVAKNLATAETTLSIFKDTEMAEIETEADRAKINNAAGSHGIGGLATDYSMNEQIEKQYALTISNMTAHTDQDIRQRNAALAITNGLADANAARAETVSKNNALLSKQTNEANADRARNATKGNAAATQATTLANLAAVKRTTLSNLLLSKQTADGNARRAWNTATANAQASLPLVATAEAAAYAAATMAPNVHIAAQTGDGMALESRRTGFALQVRTPNADATAQLGDFFLRYGYAAQRYYDMSRLSLYSKYTYWQAPDIRFTQRANSFVMQKMRDIFRAGVTVWARIEDIGTFCIYENEKVG